MYASVGFGGGSSYLALLAVAGWPVAELRFTALLCNVAVVGGNVRLFLRQGLLNGRKILPLVVASVPAAFWGGSMRLRDDTFFLLLGCSLVAAALALWFVPPVRSEEAPPPARPLREAALGGSIGALSGLVGIGGGVFLSPLLHLMRWDAAHSIAATASVFILANSLAGLAGQCAHLPAQLDVARIALLLGAVWAGGQLGLRFSLRLLSPLQVRRLTALLVLLAGLEVLKNCLLS